jgi:hypothetical protein
LEEVRYNWDVIQEGFLREGNEDIVAEGRACRSVPKPNARI